MMAGSILRRIFSNRAVDTLQDVNAPGTPFTPLPSEHPSSTSLQMSSITLGQSERTPRPMKESPVRHSRSRSATSHTSGRRTSYDSVREAQDIPQSFKRRPRVVLQDEEACASFSTSPDSFRAEFDDGYGARFGKDGRRSRRRSNSLCNRPTASEVALDDLLENVETVVTPVGRRTAPIEDLPFEILDDILSRVTAINPNNEYASPYSDLVSCLQVSRVFYEVGVPILYRQVSVPHSIKFSTFMGNIERDTEWAKYVRRLDFSRYSNIGFGRTKQASSELMNVTPQTLRRCLDLTTNLQEFLVHEHLDDELNEDVLAKAFSMPAIEALDFCACSSPLFTTAFSKVAITQSSKISSSLKRLSLHECTTLQAQVFEALMPTLHNLTHLDLAHTLITDDALWSIPKTARITHLNLGRCTRITGSNVVRFLTQHPAVKDTLVFLNLMAESSRYRLLSSDDLNHLLPQLPSSLKSLNIGGARLNPTHLSHLIPLTKHVEELGLADADLESHHLEQFFKPCPSPCTIRYLDLTGIRTISQFSLQYPSSPGQPPLVSSQTHPLEVIELSESVLDLLKQRSPSRRDQEWTVRELGRRGWLVRVHSSTSSGDDGHRPWKMGARWWGMRKIPVAHMEVGGMYGFYAFKRI